MINLYFLMYTSSLQPKDWDDREYIDDPDDVKPEVCDSTTLPNMHCHTCCLMFHWCWPGL